MAMPVRPAEVRDEVIYRCMNMSCARSLPRRVNYCPYCGINQSSGAPRPVQGGQPGVMPEVATEPVLAAAQRADIGSVGAAPTAFGGNARAAAEAERELATPIESAAPPGVATPGVATRGVATPGTSTLPPTPAAPPRRQPVRLRWWLLALGALWLIWITQRPTPARFDARVDKAIALAQACKANEAQSELIALKKTAATPAQLARLQTALDDADVACRRPARARSPARSTARSSSQSQSVRNLMSDARTSLARGDYRAAADKMEVCVAMVDANTRECSELK
ncbi:MAG: hypothetical protein JWP59_1312, partial [Massilia sp.]|nr:hypothetical protein [Massilia sp.]